MEYLEDAEERERVLNECKSRMDERLRTVERV